LCSLLLASFREELKDLFVHAFVGMGCSHMALDAGVLAVFLQIDDVVIHAVFAVLDLGVGPSELHQHLGGTYTSATATTATAPTTTTTGRTMTVIVVVAVVFLIVLSLSFLGRFSILSVAPVPVQQIDTIGRNGTDQNGCESLRLGTGVVQDSLGAEGARNPDYRGCRLGAHALASVLLLDELGAHVGDHTGRCRSERLAADTHSRVKDSNGENLAA